MHAPMNNERAVDSNCFYRDLIPNILMEQGPIVIFFSDFLSLVFF